jgi:hypothetical protein
MVDPTDRDADRLDAWLDSDGKTGGDDLTAFAGRLLRDAALPDEPAELSREQRDRIRARVLGGAPDTEKARPTVPAATFAPNGATSTPIPNREPERSAPSKLSILMTAALVALIAVAGLVLARGSLDLPGGGGDPAPADMPALAYSPVASPAAEANCSRDQMISVFEGTVPDILKDTAHATLDDGTLTWHCNGDSEELATGIRKANGVFWPGVIVTVTEHDTVRLLNIARDASIEFDRAPTLGDDGQTDFVWSHGPEPWVIVPADGNRTDWRIIDVRSMDSLLLSDARGEPLEEPSEPDFGQITGTDVAVISWRARFDPRSATPIPGGIETRAATRALVLPGSIQQRRWIEVSRYGIQSSLRHGYSDVFSVSRDGTLLAYAAEVDGDPVIRVEKAVSGERVAEVPVDALDYDTHFILAGHDDRLITSNGDAIAVHDLTSGEIIVERAVSPVALWLYPTADPDTILVATGGTSVTPIDVRDGTIGDAWPYVPPVMGQLFGDYQMPKHLVRVVSAELGGTPAIIQLVNPATGEAVLKSEPVDANPVQIVSFTTWLRNGGELALVPIGYNRAVVLDAATGETWQLAAPVDDDRLWRFFPSYDGRFITAYPEPPVGTTGANKSDAWVAPLKPGAEWVPLEGASADAAAMLVPGTPAG